MINTGKFAGKTVFITGASRGIGKAIALKVAKDGANVVIAAKTTEPHPKLEGTIFTAAKEVEAAGGKCLPVSVDLRSEEAVVRAIDETVKKFGGIDILVNNASAINMSGTEELEMKRFDLMHQINTRGTFMASKYAIPHLKKSQNPHILNISPPLVLDKRWYKNHVAYTMAKIGMSMCVLGMSEELRPSGIAVNALWPRTAIWTAAMEMLAGNDISKNCRKPSIMSDAAYAILSKDSKTFTGNFCIDDEVLKTEGITDLDQYAVAPGNPFLPDFFLSEQQMKAFDSESLELYRSQQNSESSPSSGDKITKIFDALKAQMTDNMRKEINAALLFVIGGKNWIVDTKTERPLKIAQEEAENPDVTFITDDETFEKMAKGEVKSTNAFMSGKLKIKGNIAIAMKAEKLFGKLKSNL